MFRIALSGKQSSVPGAPGKWQGSQCDTERLTGEKVREGSGGERKKEAFAGSPALTLSEIGKHWKF